MSVKPRSPLKVPCMASLKRAHLNKAILGGSRLQEENEVKDDSWVTGGHFHGTRCTSEGSQPRLGPRLQRERSDGKESAAC